MSKNNHVNRLTGRLRHLAEEFVGDLTVVYLLYSVLDKIIQLDLIARKPCHEKDGVAEALPVLGALKYGN